MAYPTYQSAYPYIGVPYQQPAISVPANSPNNNNNGIIWVQGEAGAKSYLVAPNSTVQLWDSEAQTIYLKSADTSGMPSMKILDYTIRAQEGSQKPLQGTESVAGVEYATKDDLRALKGEIIDMVKEELKA